MSTQPSIEETRLSLNAHATAKGEEFRAKYGPVLDWDRLQRALQDRACVRYPTEIVFSAGSLLEGEMAYPAQKGKNPEEGFTLFVHPCFATRLEAAIDAILYQLVVVNYGPFASAEDAETFGASVLGISREAYYQRLCKLAGMVSRVEVNRAV